MGVRAKWTNVQNRPAQLLITAATIYTMARGSLMQPPNAKAVAGWYILYKSINVHYKLIIDRYVLFPQLYSNETPLPYLWIGCQSYYLSVYKKGIHFLKSWWSLAIWNYGGFQGLLLLCLVLIYMCVCVYVNRGCTENETNRWGENSMGYVDIRIPVQYAHVWWYVIP